ncbi:LOW QUALITY PROTEIN: sodium- and chloride-dependent GABA transporter 1 [Nematostella vectensis]|uniref:LOW QUALITY PROTEIN: sodium- and chloride-dependent GABA transporter 1 n=1 Tax=Nematostella vectensis TaxID=45351 RepID=UPI002077025D|nr:LOW QUALITY PROTEIN: sodium- and chloride-dependent GABA transporter 1 [Nematostella vectensis]
MAEKAEQGVQPVLLLKVTPSTTPLFDSIEMCNVDTESRSSAGSDSKKLSDDCPEVVVVDEREKWGSKMDFLLSCVGYAVGLGNVWRFPYLCYSNGGASFLLPYILMLAFNGVPLFFMELALGQYLSLGPIGVWTAMCPMSRGVGFAMIMISFLVSIYYNIIIAWAILFLYNSFRAQVPWKTCDNDWNSPFCREKRFGNFSFNCTELGLAANCTPKFTSPPEEFFNKAILNISSGMDKLGSIQWPILLCLILSWLLVYFCLVKGVKSSGKVVYVTATFPYVILVILFGRGVSLEGAVDGILFYVNPEWDKLLNPEVWVRAATQIFYSLGIGFGSLVTFASYNRFNNNCQKDAVVVALINCGTSIFAGFVIFSVMGYMAFTLGTTVDKVATSGPGLAFVAYPEAIAQMPVSTLWAILFFCMILTLGLDSQFAMVECVITGLVDEYPKYLRKYKWLVLIVACLLMFLLAVPMCAEGGMYVFNLFDYQSGGIALLFLGFCEVMFIGWGVGTEKLSIMIKNMIGKKPNWYFIFCWKFLSPVVCLAVIVAQLVMWKGVSYGGKPYPGWAEIVGWGLALCSMALIPIFAISEFYHAKGSTFREKLRNGMTPNPEIFRDVEEKQRVGRGVDNQEVIP